MAADAEPSRAMRLLGMLLGAESDEDRVMIVGCAYQIPDEEILAVTEQLASELVDLDEEAARVHRKIALFLVKPMLESPGERWPALGCRIGERFLEQDIGWERDRGRELVLGLASCYLQADPPEPLRAIAALARLDVPAVEPEARLAVKRLIALAHRQRDDGLDDLVDVLGEMLALRDDAGVRLELARALRMRDGAGDAQRADALETTQTYREAWSEAGALEPRERLRLACAYAQHLLAAGDFPAARELGERALQLADAEDSTTWAVVAALVVTSCCEELGDDDGAGRYRRVAVDRWEAARQDPDARDEALAPMHEQLAALHRRLAQDGVDCGDVEGAFDMVLRMRGRTLGELLAVRAAPPSRAVPAGVWQAALAAWEERDRTGEETDQQHFDACIERVRALDPLAGRILDLRSPAVAEIAATLPAGCALVMFVPLPGGLYAFVARPELRAVKLSGADPAAVAEAVLDWVVEYDEFRFGGPQDPERLAAIQDRLAAHLARLAGIVRVDRLYRHLRGIERLQLVAYRPLSLLPLHALPGRRLIDRFDCSYLPAAAFAGVPSVDAVRVEDVAGAVVDSLRGTPRALLYAGLEAAALRRCFADVTVVEGAGATRTALLDVAERCAHLHLACHGEQSFKGLGKLLVAGGETVEAGELGRAGAPTGLVVLSGCDTGLAPALTLGDEYLAFPAALVAFGTGAVVGTMWQIEDRAAVLVMERFYDGLRRGRSPARSLRLAQNWLRRADGPALASACDAVVARAPASVATRMLALWAERQRGLAGRRRYEHPFYWAPLFLTGTIGARDG